MIGRADIEGSKSNVGMNSWLPQASYPCGNFSDTSSFKFRRSKGSIGHAFTVRIRTENQNQTSFYPFVPREISVLVELVLGHLRYLLTDVPPQPNSPPDYVFNLDRESRGPAERWTPGKREVDAGLRREGGGERRPRGRPERKDEPSPRGVPRAGGTSRPASRPGPDDDRRPRPGLPAERAVPPWFQKLGPRGANPRRPGRIPGTNGGRPPPPRGRPFSTQLNERNIVP